MEQQEPSAHSQKQIYLWRARTDAAYVRGLSARGRPSRGAGETGSHKTAGSKANAVTSALVAGEEEARDTSKRRKIDSSTAKG